jgi:hypothetical protein
MVKHMWIILSALVLFVSAGSPASALDITVIMPGGQALQVTLEPDNTIAQLKAKVYSASELSPLNQLVFKGKQQLDEKRTLASYNIANGDTLIIKHGVLNAPTQKEKGAGIWILLTIVIIIGVGVLFMRKKPNREYDGK